MVKSLSFLLIAFAVSTPAHADVFSYFSSNVGPEQVIEAPMQSAMAGGGMYGYPFYSGCCEAKSPCASYWWQGYTGAKGCCHKSRHFGHAKGNCGKGGCAAPAPCGPSQKSHWRHTSYRGHVQKGGWQKGHVQKGGWSKGGCCPTDPCGSKGCNTCGPRVKNRHCKLGLFDWMHYGHGKGCKACGGVGCNSCGGGKGGHFKGGYSVGGFKGYAPVAPFNESYYGSPTEALEAPSLQPPEVLVEPTTTEVSDRSAWRQTIYTNPFARPMGY